MEFTNFITDTLLNISVLKLNLFSFVLGMIYAMVQSTWYGARTRVWLQVVLYFIIVAVYYAGKAYLLEHPDLLPK
jgi:uncharacterized membrane protein YagU involved in acid resistance